MAISQKNGSKRSPVSSSSKSKLKPKNTWDFKRELVKKRLMDLTNMKNNIMKNFFEMLEQGDSVKVDKAITRHSPKENATCVGLSNSAMERAQEVEANLPPNFPSFVKLLLPSHVAGGFWLGLPKQFCHAHLPKKDATIVLVDEDEHEHDTKYLVAKIGLSGGWRGFSIEHNLLEGDVLVFQLIEPRKFKIYIVRARTLTEVDGAINLLTLDVHAEPIEAVKMEDQPEENTGNIETTREPLAADNDQTKDMQIVLSTSEPARDKSDDNCENYSVEKNGDGIRFSESLLSFKDVKGFQDFSIHVDGLILDSEIPKHLKSKYYELCRSQNMFLHDNLVQGLNSKLAAGMISETINIADAIRAAKFSTTSDHLKSWDKTLKAFEDLGMEVGFLRARIQKLLSLSRESQDCIKLKETLRAEAEEEMRALKVKLLNVKTRVQKIDAEIDDLKVKNDSLGSTFKGIAGAPW